MTSRLRPEIRFATVASLLLALTFALPGSPFGLGPLVDEFNLRWWQSAFPPTSQETDPHLLLVELPPSISSAERASWESTRELNTLLMTLHEYEAAAIGITSDLSAALPEEQDVVALFPADKRVPDSFTAYRKLKENSSTLAITWLLPPPAITTQPLVVERESRWPLYYNMHEQLLAYFLAESAGSRRLMRIDTPSNPNFLTYHDGEIVAGFELALLSIANHTTTLHWQIPNLISIGPAGRMLSHAGGLLPWAQDQAIRTISDQAIASEQLAGDQFDPQLAQRIKQKIVILGNTEDDRWQRAAARINALMTRQYSYSPWWQGLPLTLLTLLLWSCALFAMDRWSSTRLLFGTLLLASGTVALTLIGHKYYHLWLASGDTIVFTLSTGTLLITRRMWRDWQCYRQLDADDTRLQLADLLVQQGQPAAAMEQLTRTSMSQDAVDLLAKTARTFRQQGNSAAALHAYRRIHRYYPHHGEASEALRALDQNKPPLARSAPTLTLASQSAGKRLGRYELIRPLGKGAMGEVFLADDPKIRRQVAIKTLRFDAIENNPEEARQRFAREVEAAGKLKHPNIVSVYDAGEQDDLAYIAMEYVPGGTLADWTDTQQLLDLVALYQLMDKVAQAMDHAHRHNIVHRDIKPGNLLYNPDEQNIKITDFGIAQLADYSRTRTGTLLGSPYYMSPEQVSGHHIGPSSDIYSLGVTFYQLVCGSLPFDGDSLAQLAWQIANEPHVNVSRQRKGLPRSAGRIINQALAKDPVQRFSDAAAMSEAFQKGARQLASSARKAG